MVLHISPLSYCSNSASGATMHNADVSVWVCVCNADIRVCVWLGRNTSAVVVTCSDTRLTALRADVSRSDSLQPSSSLHPGRACVCLCVCDCTHYTIISVHVLFVCVRHCASLNNPSVSPDETDGKSSMRTHMQTHTHTPFHCYSSLELLFIDLGGVCCFLCAY